MKFFVTAAAVFAIIPGFVNGLTINTITTGVQECEPVQFQWAGGESPYYLSLVPNTDTGASPIKNFGQVAGTALTWTVDLASGTTFTTVLKDSTGATAFSDEQTVTSGASTSCQNTTVSDTGSVGTYSATGSVAAASATAPASTTAASASGGAAVSGSASSSGSSSAAKTSATTTSGSSNGSGRTTVGAFGLAALMGLVGAALF